VLEEWTKLQYAHRLLGELVLYADSYEDNQRRTPRARYRFWQERFQEISRELDPGERYIWEGSLFESGAAKTARHFLSIYSSLPTHRRGDFLQRLGMKTRDIRSIDAWVNNYQIKSNLRTYSDLQRIISWGRKPRNFTKAAAVGYLLLLATVRLTPAGVPMARGIEGAVLWGTDQMGIELEQSALRGQDDLRQYFEQQVDKAGGQVLGESLAENQQAVEEAHDGYAEQFGEDLILRREATELLVFINEIRAELGQEPLKVGPVAVHEEMSKWVYDNEGMDVGELDSKAAGYETVYTAESVKDMYLYMIGSPLISNMLVSESVSSASIVMSINSEGVLQMRLGLYDQSEELVPISYGWTQTGIYSSSLVEELLQGLSEIDEQGSEAYRLRANLLLLHLELHQTNEFFYESRQRALQSLYDSYGDAIESLLEYYQQEGLLNLLGSTTHGEELIAFVENEASLEADEQAFSETELVEIISQEKQIFDFLKAEQRVAQILDDELRVEMGSTWDQLSTGERGMRIEAITDKVLTNPEIVDAGLADVLEGLMGSIGLSMVAFPGRGRRENEDGDGDGDQPLPVDSDLLQFLTRS